MPLAREGEPEVGAVRRTAVNRLLLLSVAVTIAASGCGNASTERRSADPGQGSVDTQGVPGEPATIDGGRYAVSGDGLTVSVPVGGGCETTGTAAVAVEEGLERIRLTARVARPPSKPEASRPGDEFCTADLILQRVSVELREPVGSRQVIDGITGRPLTATS